MKMEWPTGCQVSVMAAQVRVLLPPVPSKMVIKCTEL